MLNPEDIFKLAKGLKLTPRDFVEQYCEFGGDIKTNFPLVRLKLTESNRQCPFSQNNRCAIHNFKPWACRLFPIKLL